MKANNINQVLIIGAGTMGKQIALQIAIIGCQVKLYDLNEELLQKANQTIKKIAVRWVKDDYISEEQAQSALERIHATANIEEACLGIQLVSESVPESINVKQQVWSQFGKYLPSDAILTSNTSTLLASQFAKSSGNPRRFLAWHFNLPTADMVDVMPHSETDPEVVDTILEFSRRIGQYPILIKKEHGNYVFNEMFTSYLFGALRLAVNDIATIEDIDRAWMMVINVPIGPFGTIDSVGVDTTCDIVREALARNPEDTYLKDIISFLQAKVERGELGRKSGKGFYSYPSPTFSQKGFAKSRKNTKA